MDRTYLFLDTEWADLPGAELVSLALISEDGHRLFYAERNPLPAEATDFVLEFVYPLLERGGTALPDAVFTSTLRAFLGSFLSPTVIYDYANDGALLQTAIAGFGPMPSSIPGQVALPVDLQLVLLKDDLVASILEDWFIAHPAEAARRHHALVDAKALRMAWLAANGRTEASWSPWWRREQRDVGRGGEGH